MARKVRPGFGDVLLEDLEKADAELDRLAAGLGSYGPVAFEIAPERLATPHRIERETAGRWTDHQTLDGKPVDQFLGPDLRTGTLEIKLLRELGVKVEEELAELEGIVEAGSAHYLSVAGQVAGQYTLRRVRVVTSRSDRSGIKEAAVTLELKEHNPGGRDG